MGCYGAGLASVLTMEHQPSRPAKPYRYPIEIDLNPYDPPSSTAGTQLDVSVCCPVCGKACGRWQFLYRSVRCDGCGVKLGRKNPDILHLANFLFLIACVFLPGYFAPSIDDSKLFFPLVILLSFVAMSLAGILTGRPWPYKGLRFFPLDKVERYRAKHSSIDGG